VKVALEVVESPALTVFTYSSTFDISLLFKKSINSVTVASKEWREQKPVEEVEPESTDNGEPCENLGEKPGKNADNLRGRAEEDNDCRKKILT
jgi:hypothetical protein